MTRHAGRYALILLLASNLLSSVAMGNLPQRNGLTLQSTRVIYPEERQKGITFKIENDTLVPYLIQSRISQYSPEKRPDNQPDAVSEDNTPFIVLPPLKRLGAGEPLTLTIRQTKKTMPSDRESVFAFQIKAIPAQTDLPDNENSGQVSMSLALQNTLKLFYRPQGLPVYDIEKIAQGLQFRHVEERLEVSNPSPYYVTFASLSDGGKSVDKNALFTMVPPFGNASYPLDKGSRRGTEISWQLIDDYGYTSALLQHTLSH